MARRVARPVSAVVLGLALAMLACVLLGWAFETSGHLDRPQDHGARAVMVLTAGVTVALGGAGWFWGRRVADVPFDRREATFTVLGIWAASGLLGALPYLLGAGMSPADAFFEAVSGFTTTGASVVRDVEGSLSRELLLWRSLTQWLGGMGIVVLFVAIFPNLGVSGKHMFRSEMPGVRTEGLVPRITDTAVVLWQIYLGFTVVLGMALWLLGTSAFDAFNHALTTMSTGGFSTRNASVAAFDSRVIEFVIAVFMLAGAVNFGLYFGLIRSRRPTLLIRSVELRTWLGIVVIVTLAFSITLFPSTGSWTESFRHGFFMVTSFATSTGFVTSHGDLAAFPPPALLLTLVLMFVGGCAGSTAGGFKVSRVVILVETVRAQLRKAVRPAVVQVVRLDRKVLDEDVQLEVAAFFFLYVLTLVAGTFVVCAWEGSELTTAFGAVLSCVSNMGPSPWYDGADGFAHWSPFSKILFALLMIVGRLEFFTVLALLVPGLWKR